MKVTIARTFLIVLFLPVALFGQENQSRTLTFGEAVKTGLENNLNLNQQKNLLVSNKVVRTAGMMSLGPTVSINGNAGRNDGNRFIQQEAKVVNGVTDFMNASLDATMPLFRGLSTLNSVRQLDNLYDAQISVVQRSTEQVIRDVSDLYLTCLLDQELVSINQKNVETQQKQYEQIREHVSAGSRAEVDLKNQEYQLKNAELLLLRAKNTLRNDKAQLAYMLGLDPSKGFQVTEPNWALPEPGNYNLDELYTIAETRRADLSEAKQREKAAHFALKSARGRYFPNITLFTSYGSAYNYIYRNEILTNIDNRSFRQQFTMDNKQLTYGVSFSIPLYGGFAARAQTAERKALYENARLLSENRDLLIKSQVLLAYQNLQDAQSAFNAAQAQLESAETSYNLENERYQLGISDIVALTLAVQNYTKAQGDFASARYTLLFQRLLINFNTGTLRPEDVE